MRGQLSERLSRSVVFDGDEFVWFGFALRSIAVVSVKWQCNVVVLVEGHNDHLPVFGANGAEFAFCPAFVSNIGSAAQKRLVKGCTDDHASFVDLFRKLACTLS